MAELRYVDWDGLVYYDGKIKEFIRDNAEDYLKMGGIVSIKDLPDPSWQNLNYIYKITDKFTSNDRFEKPGYVYPAGTWVQCVNSQEDERWLYIIFNEETIGGTADIDLSDYYTKDEVDQLIPDDFATQSDIEVIDKAVAEAQASIDELQENKADKRDLIGLATEEFVLNKIAEAELADQDAYYTKSETEAKIKEAVDSIEIPDVSNFATKSELEEAINNIEHPSIDLSSYATKEELTVVQEQSARNEVKLLQVDSELFDIKKELEEIPTKYTTKTELEDAINSIEHPTVDLEGYATEQWVKEQGFLKEHQDLSDYAKKSDLPQPELFVVDYNAPDFAAAVEAYNNGKLLLLTNAAPDGNGYAVMNYVREDLITFTKFLMSRSETYGAFNTYYLHSDNTWELAKEVKLNKVDAVVDGNNDITGLTIGKNTYEFDNFATTEVVNQINQNIENIENTYVSTDVLEQKNYVTNDYIEQQNYVTNTTLEGKEYITTSEATTKIEQIVKEEVAEAVTPDAINYDTWE